MSLTLIKPAVPAAVDATPRPEHIPVLIVGGGQAGLSMSYLLRARGVHHVVLERHRIGEAWRSHRWDSFCLVTPNWQCRLPGFAYGKEFAGEDPHGFMIKNEIVRYLEAYARSFSPPVREGVEVLGLTRSSASGPFGLTTSAGPFTADAVVVATGGYHLPRIPRMAERLPSDVVQMHSCQYRNPESLPPGEVLVVGTGQSGCQIAEDLHLAGRRVHLCVGGAPRTARWYRGRDVVAWLDEIGYYDLPVDEHPLGDKVRAKANHYVTGRDGGHDIDLRKFATEGMRLYGRLREVAGGRLLFRDDLRANLDAADRTSENIKDTIDKHIAERGIEVPAEERYRPVWEPGAPTLDLGLREAGITTVVWCLGFTSDYRWIELPLFDGKGYPAHRRGVTAVEGVYFLGLPWQHTWGSGRFSGVARDAGYLTERIVAQAVLGAHD